MRTSPSDQHIHAVSIPHLGVNEGILSKNPIVATKAPEQIVTTVLS